jgi:methionyl-tRNA synthetase
MNYDYLSSVPFLHPVGVLQILLIAVLIIWSLAIKGVALWKSARNGHKGWFIVLLLVNGLGVLELIYLIWFAKEKSTVAPAPAPAPRSLTPEA